MSTIGERLREERERIGKNQSEFAAIGGVQKRAQINYEQNERQPDAAYLRSVAQIGTDVQYVLLGIRSNNLDEIMLSDEFVQETKNERSVVVKQHAPMAELLLPSDEATLLKNYRGCSEEGKSALQATCASLAKSAKALKK